MPFELIYHPDVKDVDIPVLNKKIKSRIKKAIETRLATEPHMYVEPLRKTLKGYWKLRVGDYRFLLPALLYSGRCQACLLPQHTPLNRYNLPDP